MITYYCHLWSLHIDWQPRPLWVAKLGTNIWPYNHVRLSILTMGSCVCRESECGGPPQGRSSAVKKRVWVAEGGTTWKYCQSTWHSAPTLSRYVTDIFFDGKWPTDGQDWPLKTGLGSRTRYHFKSILKWSLGFVLFWNNMERQMKWWKVTDRRGQSSIGSVVSMD